jgi:cytochrome c oxidase assembly protein subunit 15
MSHTQLPREPVADFDARRRIIDGPSTHQVEERHGILKTPEFMKRSPNLVGYWFLATALVFIMAVSSGSLGRFTEGRLTLVDHDLFRGTIPPLTPGGWRSEYDQYKNRPGFYNETVDPVSGVNRHYPSLTEFEISWAAEYMQKILIRLLAFVFFVPMVYFWLTGQFTDRQKVAAASAAMLLIGAAGVGLLMQSVWGMDPYGSTDRLFPHTKQYRLAFYLISGLITYLILLNAGIFSLLKPVQNYTYDEKIQKIRKYILVTAIITFMTAGFGTLVAGTDAGLIYNNWPGYDEHFWGWPSFGELFALSPFWRNFFENRAMVQFLHRQTAYMSVFAVTVLWIFGLRTDMHRRAKIALHSMCALAHVQVLLGVLNLWLAVPAWLMFFHQTANVLLHTTIFWFYNEMIHVQSASRKKL